MLNHARRRVFVGACADGGERKPDAAVVLIDVLLSTTTVVTAVGQGRRTILAESVDDGRSRARHLTNPILAAEPGVVTKGEFSGTTGPARLDAMDDVSRPLVLVAPTTRMFPEAVNVFLACLRNTTATVQALSARHSTVYVVPAGFGGQARCEDEMVAAWMAQELLELAYEPGNLRTTREIERWSRADLTTLALGRGADHLRRLGREQDLDFVLNRVDDMDMVCWSHGAEVRAQWSSPALGLAAAY